MRMKLLPFLLLAGTVVGCASNPPPPPPMAEAPAARRRRPLPSHSAPMAGIYKGMAELAADAPRGCAKMTRTQTSRVRGNSIVLTGVRARSRRTARSPRRPVAAAASRAPQRPPAWT